MRMFISRINAEILKAAGLIQESVFYYHYSSSDNKPVHRERLFTTKEGLNFVGSDKENQISAYTVSELVSMLGAGIGIDTVKEIMDAKIERGETSFILAYSPAFLASCLCHLIQTQRMTVAEVNARYLQNINQ